MSDDRITDQRSWNRLPRLIPARLSVCLSVCPTVRQLHLLLGSRHQRSRRLAVNLLNRPVIQAKPENY